MLVSDESIKGKTVISADGQVVGVVGGVFLDTDSWQVQALQLKLRSEVADQLGASRGFFHVGTVPVPVRVVQSVGDTIVLSVGLDGLRQVLPEEAVEAAPDGG